MNSFRTALSISLVALVATLAGCAADTGSLDTETAHSAAVAQADATPNADRSARFEQHRGGPGSLLMTALREDIGLSAEQKTTLEALRPQRGEQRPERAAKRAKMSNERGSTLAAAIRSGDLQGLHAMAPHGKDDAAHAEWQAKAVKALETLHATLTPEQRSALVAAVGKREGQGHGREHGKRAGAEHGKREGGDALRGPMGKMLAGIDLSDAQKEQLKAKLDATRPEKPSETERAAFVQKMSTMKAEQQARLQTFASDSFDAKAFLARPAKTEGRSVKMRDQYSERFAIVLSVLDASQREQLAAKIEQGPKGRAKRMHE